MDSDGALQKDFHEVALTWADDARVPKPSDVPDQVYHYTDAAGLFGMLNADAIWLTDYRFLNDRSEFVHTRAIIDELLDKLPDDPDTREIIANIRSWQAIDANEDSFVFSFSERADDLSQWRGYAKEGLGFTIGFDARAIDALRKVSDQFNFSKVCYDEDTELKALTKAFSDLRALARKKIQVGTTDRKAVIDAAAKKFDWLAEERGSVNKHGSFRAESEWRIVSYLKKRSARIKIRVSGIRLVPYVEMRLGEDDAKLPILSIGIGPGFTTPEVADGVRGLINQTGYDAEIYFANTPYRRI